MRWRHNNGMESVIYQALQPDSRDKRAHRLSEALQNGRPRSVEEMALNGLDPEGIVVYAGSFCGAGRSAMSRRHSRVGSSSTSKVSERHGDVPAGNSAGYCASSSLAPLATTGTTALSSEPSGDTDSIRYSYPKKTTAARITRLPASTPSNLWPRRALCSGGIAV